MTFVFNEHGARVIKSVFEELERRIQHDIDFLQKEFEAATDPAVRAALWEALRSRRADKAGATDRVREMDGFLK